MTYVILAYLTKKIYYRAAYIPLSQFSLIKNLAWFDSPEQAEDFRENGPTPTEPDRPAGGVRVPVPARLDEPHALICQRKFSLFVS